MSSSVFCEQSTSGANKNVRVLWELPIFGVTTGCGAVVRLFDAQGERRRSVSEVCFYVILHRLTSVVILGWN